MTKVLAFDPGKTTGIAYLDEESTYWMGDTQDIYAYFDKIDLSKTPVDVIVYEEYFVRPEQAKLNTGRNFTIEAIGAIAGFAARNKIKVVTYPTRIKGTQAKMTQVFPKKATKAISHRLDAYNHGRYYLIQNHGAPTALELEMQKKGKI